MSEKRVLSFSYRFGPRPARRAGDMVIDCRQLPNHFPVTKKGTDPDVMKKVMSSPQAQALVKKALAHLTADPSHRVLFGCSFGRHRSVALATRTAEILHTTPEHTSPIMEGEKYGPPLKHTS